MGFLDWFDELLDGPDHDIFQSPSDDLSDRPEDLEDSESFAEYRDENGNSVGGGPVGPDEDFPEFYGDTEDDPGTARL